MKGLILTADDLGYTPGVTRGIIETHQQGVVACASLIVNSPFSADAAEAVVEEAPTLDVGLHINLTRGRAVAPLKDVGALIDGNGHFCLASAEEFATVPQGQLEHEIEAQFEHFLALMKRPPTHINLHRRWMEGTMVWLIALGLARKAADRCRVVIRARTDEARRIAKLNGVATCDHVIGDVTVRGIEPEWTFDHLIRTLATLDDGTSELVCHPGYPHDEALRSSGYNWQREAELRLFASGQLREHIERFAHLVSFTAIGAGM